MMYSWRIQRWILSLFFALSLSSCSDSESKKVKIGIIQVIEHPALDLNRNGIIKELENNGFISSGKDANSVIVWESAQANPSLAAQIAQKFIGQHMDVIITLGTLPSQAAVQARKSEKTFIVYSSVTDPKNARLLDEKNITGVSNYVPSEKQFAFMKKSIPELKTIGIIYNPGDPNSQSLLNDMETAAKEADLTLVFVQAHRTSEVLSAAQSVIGKVDAIFINNDNTALSSFSAVLSVANEHKKPVFASDVELVEKGAFAALGPDQFLLGMQAGNLAVRALKGESFNNEKLFYPKEISPHFHSPQ